MCLPRYIRHFCFECSHLGLLTQSHDGVYLRVAVVGNVDAGKSTLLGVLTHGELDNGRGFARQKLFRHKHEMESGRTSSVGNDILGFDQEGQVVNKPDSHGGSLDWTKICEKSSKVITFIDLAGHEKYLKTTVFGMTGHLPDFCMLMVRREDKALFQNLLSLDVLIGSYSFSNGSILFEMFFIGSNTVNSHSRALHK